MTKENIIPPKCGRCCAEERLHMLFDDEELDIQKHWCGDGFVAGKGRINGRSAYAASQDATVKGGSADEARITAMCDLVLQAKNDGVPFLLLLESAGARIQDGIKALDAYGKLFCAMASASGKIPMLAVVLGTCAGGAAYTAALCDFVIMQQERGQLFVTGSKVLKNATGEDSSNAELGSADIHMTQSGVAHFCGQNDRSCIEKAKQLLSYLPQNSNEYPPSCDNSCIVPVNAAVPVDLRKTYDVHSVIDLLVDQESFLEYQEAYAQNLVAGWGRIHGKTVGIVANQPEVLCGALDIDASYKAAKFIAVCDQFRMPIITLADTPGFWPGKAQEQNGLLRYGANLLSAYSKATTPKITVVLRQAIGGAYIAMNCHGLGADAVLAWNNAKIAVLGKSSASVVAEDVKTVDSDLDAAVSSGIIRKIIAPCETRRCIAEILDQKL